MLWSDRLFVVGGDDETRYGRAWCDRHLQGAPGVRDVRVRSGRHRSGAGRFWIRPGSTEHLNAHWADDELVLGRAGGADAPPGVPLQNPQRRNRARPRRRRPDRVGVRHLCSHRPRAGRHTCGRRPPDHRSPRHPLARPGPGAVRRVVVRPPGSRRPSPVESSSCCWGTCRPGFPETGAGGPRGSGDGKRRAGRAAPGPWKIRPGSPCGGLWSCRGSVPRRTARFVRRLADPGIEALVGELRPRLTLMESATVLLLRLRRSATA